MAINAFILKTSHHFRYPIKVFIVSEINWEKLHRKKKLFRKRKAKWAKSKSMTKTQNIKIEHCITLFKMSQNKSNNVKKVPISYCACLMDYLAAWNISQRMAIKTYTYRKSSGPSLLFVRELLWQTVLLFACNYWGSQCCWSSALIFMEKKILFNFFSGLRSQFQI